MQYNRRSLFIKKIFIISLSSFLFYGGIAFAGVRCGNDIISIGDTKTTVVSKLRECGDILNKDTYTKEIKTQLNKKKGGEKITIQKRIDLWSIRIRERGGHYCYPLTFEDDILTEIGQWSRCD
ncbi:DUF2845 domain-containing protein [uncultured Desulfobacter sp.]|uniref:DUF2845 domain-containing protein n=1 Tax=uncultured Desulfobacter sp. TaxID=240139 RepID=UPI0029C60FFD|nr:DUF2845 domain-containing protein [uncultured Desulfobacter sp.]